MLCPFGNEGYGCSLTLSLSSHSLGIGTTFVKFLTCIETQKIYLDPAGKIILNTEKKQEQKPDASLEFISKTLKNFTPILTNTYLATDL